MAWQQLGDITFHRILELEEPFVIPTEMFAEATPENLDPHRHWLEPSALCPETGKLILPVQSYVAIQDIQIAKMVDRAHRENQKGERGRS